MEPDITGAQTLRPKPVRTTYLTGRLLRSLVSAVCFATFSSGVGLSILIFQSAPAWADGNPLNGTSPRPFYVFAHNPNTIADVERALSQGANALEPDINIYLATDVWTQSRGQSNRL